MLAMMGDDKGDDEDKLTNCQDYLKSLESVENLNVEEYSDKLDGLIGELYILKAKYAVIFDFQFFSDILEASQSDKATEDAFKRRKQIVRRICMQTILHLAKTIHNNFNSISNYKNFNSISNYKNFNSISNYKNYMKECAISKVITMIKLEYSLLRIRSELCGGKFPKRPRAGKSEFPSAFLTFLVGCILNSSGFDEKLVNAVINLHPLQSEVYRCNLLSALEFIINDLENPQPAVWDNPETDSALRTRRFIVFMLNMPVPRVQPQWNNSKRKTTTHGRSRDYECEMDEKDKSGLRDDSERPRSHSYLKRYARLWYILIFNFMRVPEDMLPRLLEHLPEGVIPYLSNPLILADRLMDLLSLDTRGTALNVLSLKVVFELILKYGLGEEEFHDENSHPKTSQNIQISMFYERLYNLIDPMALSDESGKALLELLRVSLGSSMLPSWLIAHFIKKLVRMACLTTCVTSTTLLVISLNLLKKHHRTCLSIIHQDSNSNTCATVDKFQMKPLSDILSSKHKSYNSNPNPNIFNDTTNENDYITDENDNVKNEDKAECLELYLWELSLLLRHFNEGTARIAGLFYSDLTNKTPLGLEPQDFVGCDPLFHLKQEISKAKKSNLNSVNPFRKVTQNSTLAMSNIF